MISLDQVLLLQRKVETAVDKISQLKSDNDALRSKCAELTKALSEKTELVSRLESEQSKIEEGILTALNRLDIVENSVLTSSEEEPEQAPVPGADTEDSGSPHKGEPAQTGLLSSASAINGESEAQSAPAENDFSFEEDSTGGQDDGSKSSEQDNGLTGQFEIF